MSITIKFKNVFGNEITQHQAQLLTTTHRKESYDNGVLKKIDIYDSNNQIFSVVFYLDNINDLPAKIVEANELCGGGQFYFNKEQILHYTVWDVESYRGTTKTFKGKKVFDEFNRIIASREIEPISLELMSTTKFFYIENLGEFEEAPVIDQGILEFRYDPVDLEEDQIEVQINLAGFDHESQIISSDKNILLHPMIVPIFSWEDNSYYHSAEPLVPIS